MYRDAWKNSKDTLARQEENDLRRAAHRDRIFAKLGAFGSKVSNPGSRAKPDEDQLVMKKIAKYMKFGAQVALTSNRPSPVHKRAKTTSKRKKKLSQSYSKRLIRSANNRIQLIGPWIRNGASYQAWFPNWSHTSYLVKAMAYGMAIPQDRRFAFTLKLSDHVIEQGLRAKKGFAGFMQDRIARYLRNALPADAPKVNFVFVVEAWGRHEKPHIQGTIELEQPLPFGEYGYEIREALHKAGGTMAGKSKASQLNDKVLYEAAGWFSYLGKRRMVTTKAFANMRKRAGIPALSRKESLVGATDDLQKAGKQWFKAAMASRDYVLYSTKFRPRGVPET